MGRILGIDFGKKRTGIAVTDPQKIIASPLCVVESDNAMKFIDDYCKKEEVETIVIGMPKDLNNMDTHSTIGANNFVKLLKIKIKHIPIMTTDERYTSKIAFQTMIDGGIKKKERKNKKNIDKISATIILQSYLDSKTNSMDDEYRF